MTAAHMKSAMSDPVAETILIRETEISFTPALIEHSKLRFFVENPRVYSILRTDGVEPSQADIERKLLEMDHVKSLIQDIKRDGGLTDPVVVRAGKMEVLEGNSRLAAYRALEKQNPIKWAKMKCRLIPEDLDESLIFALLGQYHIRGKKDWAPFEQAGFLYRRAKTHNIAPATLAHEIGLTTRKVEQLINTYQFMLDHGEVDTARWSYYDEYLKSASIKKARLKIKNFDEIVVGKIKSGEIARAVDVRDRLPIICEAPKSLQKFGGGTYDFEEAHEHAVEAGADSGPLKKLHKFRMWLAKPETDHALSLAQGETRKKMLFELEKISARADAMKAKLKSKG